MMIVESAGLTDIGKKRKNNEDALFFDDDMRLYVVADGVGGHQAGEVASRLVVETIRDYMARFENGQTVEEMTVSDAALSHEANRLLSAIALANLGVNQLARSKETYRGMGSTVSAIYFSQEMVIVANVGDSPIYLVHNGSIETLSVSHTVHAQQAALDPGSAGRLDDRFKHMLTRAMGIEERVNPDVSEIQYFKGDILLMGSDGLTDKVSPEEILEVVTSRQPATACRTLVDMANDRGGDDNITVIVIKIKGIMPRNIGILGAFVRAFKGVCVSPLRKIFKNK